MAAQYTCLSNAPKAWEPLFKSGSNRLSVKMFWFKAWNAGHKCVMGRAIAKFRNAETGHFKHKMSIHDLIRGSLAV